MTGRILVIVCITSLAAIFTTACSTLPGPLSPNQANPKPDVPKTIDPQQVQATTMSFATRYVIAMADVYDRVARSSTTPEARALAMQNKLLAGVGAMGNAVNTNPIVGFMDMALMVTLSRESIEEPWARDTFGPENHSLVVATLKAEEADIWGIAPDYLTADEITELRAIAARWRQEHPQQRYVGSARLADFPEAKQPSGPDFQIAKGIFNLVRLDPFSGLDPAVRQIDETRILAERMFFYLQNMPPLLSWQTDMLYTQMISQPQITQLLKDTSTVSTNSTGFTSATTQFADATTAFAKSIETFRAQLPEQQATLVKQTNDMIATQTDAALKQTNNIIATQTDAILKQANANIATLRDTTVQQVNDLVATQRDGALKQAASEIAAQRDAAIKQLGSTITTQQDLIAKNLQGVLDNSMNQLYKNVRSLILIAAASLLAVLVIYRFIARQWPVVKTRP